MVQPDISLPAAAREAYASWLAQAPWDVFVTLTDGGYPHPEHMVKRARYLEHKVNASLYGHNWRRKGKGIETVTGLEKQRRGSIHTHALWRLPDHDARDRTQFSLAHWQRFATSLGGWAWLEVPKSTEDVCRYVAKYVCKDGELILGDRLNPDRFRSYSQTLLGSAAVAARGRA